MNRKPRLQKKISSFQKFSADITTLKEQLKLLQEKDL